MNRLTLVYKQLKRVHMETRRLSDELAQRRLSAQALLQEKEGITRGVEQAEDQYRQILHGEMTVFQLERIADVRAFITCSEDREIEVSRRLQEVEREVDNLVEQLHRRHGIARRYEELAEQLLQEERGRRNRRFENQCDELGLIRWSRHEGR